MLWFGHDGTTDTPKMQYRQGHDIASVRQLLGHASVATTQRYIAVGADEMRAAAAGAWIEAS